MSRIDNLLKSILAAVYGKDVRQSIHDSIKECYDDVTTAKTLADESIANSKSAATSAESRINVAISSAESKVNTAVANANAATTSANTAASNANTKANTANQAAIDVKKAFDDLGLVYVNGKLCVKVERT